MKNLCKNLLLGAILLTLCACGGTGTETSSESTAGCDTTVYSDECHLALDFKGHNFVTDGIGEVQYVRHIDGDTTHFYPLKADGTVDNTVLVKARYNCINTPESTGSVEDWGYDASDFTHGYVENAKTIVLSSNRTDYGTPEMDGNGRYLCYVWVSDKENASLEDLKLLNLMIVEAGFSPAQGAEDSIYADYFYDADRKASCEGNYIWSNKEDPRVPTAAISTTIQELVEGVRFNSETEEYDTFNWTDPSANPHAEGETVPSSYRVTFECTVAYSFEDGGDNAYVYAEYPLLDDPATIRRYGIYVFGGYKTITPLRRPGWRLQMNGIVASYNGNLQITDVSYSALYPGDDYIQIIEKTDVEYVPPVVTAADLQDDYYANQVVEIKNLHGLSGEWGTYGDESGTGYTILCEDGSGYRTYIRAYSGTIRDRNNNKVTITAENFESYFCKEGETFNVIGPVVRYTNSKGDTFIQVQILKNENLTFNE